MNPLLKQQIRTIMPVTIIATLVSAGYVMFVPTILIWRSMAVLLFVFAHSLAMAALLSRGRTPSACFYITRGLSRDALWNGKMLATLSSVFAVVVLLIIVINGGLRSAFQDRAFENPEFPIMASLEHAFPFQVLLMYGYVAPIAHYMFIKPMLPVRRGANATGLMLTMLIGLIVVSEMAYRRMLPCCVAALAAAAVVVLVASRKIHQNVEVL